ncbi:hypothetical protein TWF225_000324 [Orbilia oligospora]|uniref:Uncharacterized protein n=2 Tax=Orbilia oligospora TaxID=2813651 RepID=A0A7C8PY15_ORBOL|nr:hypothetical protein TWF751_004361 [Orbilia oligospora]KAF3195972.1 hypothetical protein TWF225_000324 [Orbilia oligospora]KAF3266559.1 hypothetical protein TWF128_010940 [Orbilia oligospora]KAF3272116.1 hypothetical protein TWF217_003929 [Orbilia oligospora]KAF3297714.1 hypothetical protein TWF132_006114 [Orbilia oligospora]
MAANRQIECERSNRMDTTAGLDAPPLKDSTSQYGYLVYFKTRPTSIVFLGSIIYDLSLASYTSPSGRYNNYCEPRHSSNISEASNRYAVLSCQRSGFQRHTCQYHFFWTSNFYL